MENKALDENRVVGAHYILDLFGCNRQQINSVEFLKKVMTESIDGTNIVLLDEAFFPFEPQGVTGFLLLSTSHMSVHSWPEHGYLSIDVYTCSSDAMTRKVVDYILEKILHRRMVIKSIDRTYNLLPESAGSPDTLRMPVYSDGSEQLIHVTERVANITSGFQKIEIVDTDEFGRCMLIDGVMQTSEKDHQLYDEAVLKKLTKNDARLLILGGGDGYVAEAALEKNPNLAITIIDLDVEVVMSAKKHLGQKVFDHPNVTLFIGDALQYLKTNKGEHFDGIISDLTDNPMVHLEDSYERDYTHFFEQVLMLSKKHLAPDGWIAIQGGTAVAMEKYLNTAAIVERLTTEHFSGVEREDILIPSFGEKNAFIFGVNR
ncbi:MAG TPA: adenosylmethionine decarboxylase [Candidatus Paceibacterota bacterium]